MVTAKLVVLGVVLASESGILDVGDDAEDGAIGTVKSTDALADWTLVREQAASQRLAE